MILRSTDGIDSTSVSNSLAVSTSTVVGSVVVTDGVAAPPTGSVYQLWLISASGAATPAGFLPAPTNGTSAAVLSGDARTAGTVGMTVEPAGGSPQPTTKPVLVLKV